MEIYVNRVRRAYLRKRIVRDALCFALLLLIFVVPYLVVATLDCLVSAPRLCTVERADTVAMYEVEK